MQLIHYKESLGSFENALNDPDGLAILSVFFQVKNHEIYIFFKKHNKRLKLFLIAKRGQKSKMGSLYTTT